MRRAAPSLMSRGMFGCAMTRLAIAEVVSLAVYRSMMDSMGREEVTGSA